MQQQNNNNNKQSRSSGRNTGSSSTRGFSTSRSRSNASSTTRVFSNPPPVVSQQQGATCSSTTRGFSTSTPVVSQQQTFHPISIDLTTTSITQLPNHLTKMLSKKPSKTKLSPILERNSNPNDQKRNSNSGDLKRNSNSGGVSDVSEVDFASIMSSPEDLLIPDFLRTPPRQISPEVAQLDMVNISTDLEEHNGFGDEHLDTYLPDYFHDMPTTWDQPEEIPASPSPDEDFFASPVKTVPEAPKKPVKTVSRSSKTSLKPKALQFTKQKICPLTTDRSMKKETPTKKITNTSILACLKSIHDAYLYSLKNIPVTIEEEHIASILGPGTLDEQRTKIRDIVRECSDTQYKQLEKTFKKNYHMDLQAYGDKIKELVRQVKYPARNGTPPPAPKLSPVEPQDLSSEEEVVEESPPPKPHPITLSAAVQAKILINRCRQSARLPPLNVPEECTIEELTEAVRDEVQALDEIQALLEDELLEQQEVPEEKEEMLDIHMVQVYKEYETICQLKKIQPMGISMFPSEQDILQAIQSIQGPPPPPPVNFLPRSAAEIEAVEVLEPLEPLEPEEEFNSPLPPEVLQPEPEVEEFTVAYAEYAGICEDMGLEPKEMADFSDFKEIDAEIERLETPHVAYLKAAAEPKPEPKDPTPEPDVDAVKLPESEEDEQDDEDPISPDRKTQLVQVFARYSKIPTDVFLILIDYTLSVEEYIEAAAVVKAHHRLLDTEIPYCLKHMSRVFLNYFDHFYKVKEIPAHQCYKTDDYNLLVMMRDNIYKMQERRYRYATSHRPMIDYLIGKPARVQELKGIIDAEHSQLNLANQMAIENMPEEYTDVDVTVWQPKSQNVTALHELGSLEYVAQNEREQKFQEQLQNNKAIQRRNKKQQKRKKNLANLHAAAEPKDPKRDEPDTDAPDFTFTPTVSTYTAEDLQEYSRRGPVNTKAIRYPDDQSVKIVEPLEKPVVVISKSRKSKKIRRDVYADKDIAPPPTPLPPKVDIEDDFRMVPEYTRSSNIRVQNTDRQEAAAFTEDGEIIMVDKKPRGRPKKISEDPVKFVGGMRKRGRPRAQPSPPWTPAVLPVSQWYSPTSFLQGVPEPQPVPSFVRDVYAAYRENRLDTFNETIQTANTEPPLRPPRYTWEDRRTWDQQRFAHDVQADYRRRFVSAGLMPVSESIAPVALQPPPAPRLRPIEPVMPVHMLAPEEIAAIPVEEELQPLEEFDPFADELKAFVEEEPEIVPRRKRGRPRKWKPEIHIGKRSFEKRKRELQRNLAVAKEKIANAPVIANLYNNGRNLNEPYLSTNLVRVYKRVIPLDTGNVFRDTGFIFNYDPGTFLEATALGPRNIFDRQTENIQRFVQHLIGRQITRWRFMVHYNGPNGYRTISTQWISRYSKAHHRISQMIGQIMDRYGEEELHIDQYEVRVVSTDQALFGGVTGKEIQERLDSLKSTWFVVNPHSKTNCLWTAIAICDGFTRNPKLITDTKVQNAAGKLLKRNVGTRNERGGGEEDLEKCCQYKGRTIIVYNDFTEVMGTFIPDEFKSPAEEPLHLLLYHGHYHALLPKDHPAVSNLHASDIGQEERELQPIAKPKKELVARKIVAYDLESYKDPHGVSKHDGSIENQIHQVAYACGWAFEIEGKEEEAFCRENGYEVITYPFMNKEVTVGYKQILGETCLDESLEQWLTQPMFHDAVFYAHNGGKFDIRLILGQSDLMYKEAYVIQPEKTIELNGRIINLDVQNITQDYTIKKTNKKGETREVKTFHCISLRDSIPLFGPGSSLASLCKELKVPHLKLEELVNVHDLQYEDTWLLNWYGYDMDKYLRNDCLGLLEVLTQFNAKVIEGTAIPITAVNTGASLAKKFFLMHYYRNEFDEKDSSTEISKTVFTLNKDMDQFIRQGYGGGRCEAFISKEWQERCYYYDFTSLYPDVARRPMPTGRPKWITDPDDPVPREVEYMWRQRVLNRDTEDQLVYWKVRVRSPLAAAGQPTNPDHRKPLFGMKEQDMYVFRWYTEWTEMVLYEPELLFAIDQGLDYEFEPVNGIMFESEPILKDCMEELFKKKAEATAVGEDALAKTWKIIINSLYGVWGLKVLDREGIEISRPEKSNWAIDLVTDKLMDIEKIGRYIVTRRLKDLEVSDCNVAIAAAVTSEARLKLYRLMMDIQNHGGKVLYCDTDSIITSLCIEEEKEMSELWIGPTHGKDLGTLKNEIDKCYEKLQAKDPRVIPTPYFDKAVIVAPKLYIVSGADGRIIKKAHKGYQENESKGDTVSYERMKKLIDLTIPPEERIMVQTTGQWLGGNRDILQNQIGVRIVEREKRLKQTVNKGVLSADGNIVPYNHLPPKK